MSAHLRANLWLLVLTVLLCSVLYPLVLWGIGQSLFHDKAQGSLLPDAGATRSVRGSSRSRSLLMSISSRVLPRRRLTLRPRALPTGRRATICCAIVWRGNLAPL